MQSSHVTSVSIPAQVLVSTLNVRLHKVGPCSDLRPWILFLFEPANCWSHRTACREGFADTSLHLFHT
jgi:hypothetical protein